MDPTIYTLGDVELFRAALTALAMVFDPSTGEWNSNGGFGFGAAVAMGLMLSLLVIGVRGVTQQDLRLDTLLVVFILYIVLFVPTTRVQLEDVVTGEVAAVDDVPVGVAWTGSIVSSMVQGVTRTFETVFQTADADYVATDVNGFLSPLRLLLALRDINPDRVNSRLTNNLRHYVWQCTVGNSEFSQDDYNASSWKMAYLLQVNAPNIVRYFPALTPNTPDVIACGDAADRIRIDINAYLATGGGVRSFESQLNQEAPVKPWFSTDPTAKWTTAEWETTLTNTIASIGADAQLFMEDALFMNLATAGMGCGNHSDDAGYFMCISTMTQALEQQKVDSAAAGSIFQKTVLPAMNIFLFLFFAFAPIVALVMVATGPMGPGILVKYLLFGVWTQSWFAFISVINFYIQGQTQLELEAFAASIPFGSHNYQQFYDVLSTKIMLGGELLAATPIISLAVLTGSIFTFTRLATTLSSKDKVDEKATAPDIGSTGAVVSVAGRQVATEGHGAAAMAATSGFVMGAGGGFEGMNGGVATSVSRAGSAGAVTVSSQGVLQTRADVAEKHAATETAQAVHAANTAIGMARGFGINVGNGKNYSVSEEDVLGTGRNASQTRDRGFGNSVTGERGTKEVINTQLGGEIDGAVTWMFGGGDKDTDSNGRYGGRGFAGRMLPGVPDKTKVSLTGKGSIGTGTQWTDGVSRTGRESDAVSFKNGQTASREHRESIGEKLDAKYATDAQFRRAVDHAREERAQAVEAHQVSREATQTVSRQQALGTNQSINLLDTLSAMGQGTGGSAVVNAVAMDSAQQVSNQAQQSADPSGFMQTYNQQKAFYANQANQLSGGSTKDVRDAYAAMAAAMTLPQVMSGQDQTLAQEAKVALAEQHLVGQLPGIGGSALSGRVNNAISQGEAQGDVTRARAFSGLGGGDDTLPERFQPFAQKVQDNTSGEFDKLAATRAEQSSRKQEMNADYLNQGVVMAKGVADSSTAQEAKDFIEEQDKEVSYGIGPLHWGDYNPGAGTAELLEGPQRPSWTDENGVTWTPVDVEFDKPKDR